MQAKENALPCSCEESVFAYILQQDQTLNTTGFKVMRNLAGDGLVPAYTSTLNGRLRLVYDTGDLAALSALAPRLTPSQFAQIALGLFRALEKIRANGFIHPENVLLDQEHLMVDQDMGVHLIYLPVDGPGASTARLSPPELDLRRFLIHFVDQNPHLRSERIARLYALLKNDKAPLSGAQAVLDLRVPTNRVAAPQKHRPLQLVRAGGRQPICFTVGAKGIVIGRDPQKATDLLPDGSVSGEHCKISPVPNGWLLEDLGSRNGTRLNGHPLRPHVAVPLAVGDVVEISRFIFTVQTQEPS